MANQTGRPIAPARKLVAAVLGTIAVFVMVFGLGLSSWPIVALGAALLALSITLGMVNVVRRGARAWVAGSGQVKAISEAPLAGAYGRAEIQLTVVAPGLPITDVLVRDSRVPVGKWPRLNDTLPISVDVDDMRRVRIRWDDAADTGDDGDPPPPPAYEPAEDYVDDDLLGEPEPPPWATRDREWGRGPDEPPPPPPAPDPDVLTSPIVVHETPGGKVLEGQFINNDEIPQTLPKRARTASPPAGSPSDSDPDFPAAADSPYADSSSPADSPYAASSSPADSPYAASSSPADSPYAATSSPADSPYAATSSPADSPYADSSSPVDSPSPADSPSASSPIPGQGRPPGSKPSPRPRPAGATAASAAASAGTATVETDEGTRDNAPAAAATPDDSTAHVVPGQRAAGGPGGQWSEPPPPTVHPHPATPDDPDIDLLLDGDPEPPPEDTPAAQEAREHDIIAPPADDPSSLPPEPESGSHAGAPPSSAEARPARAGAVIAGAAAAAPAAVSAAAARFRRRRHRPDPVSDLDPAPTPAPEPDPASTPPEPDPDPATPRGPDPTPADPPEPEPASFAPPQRAASAGAWPEPVSVVAPQPASSAAAPDPSAAAPDPSAAAPEPKPSESGPASAAPGPEPAGATAASEPSAGHDLADQAAGPWADLEGGYEPDERTDDLITAYPSARPGPAGAIHGIGITVLVTDLDRSRTFYRETLGFFEIDTGPGSAVLASGDTRLVLRSVHTVSAGIGRLIYLNLEVGDVGAVYEELRSKGVTFEHAPRPVNRGDRLELWAATFYDPDGHNIAITQWRAVH